MSMSKKLTKKEMFAKLKGLVGDNADMVAFIDHEIELLTKKNGNRKPTKAQEENNALKEIIVNGMESGKEYTITDLTKSIAEISDLSNQRVSALVRQLKEENLVARNEIKGKAYFSKVV